MPRYIEEPVGQRVAFNADLLLVHARDKSDADRPVVILVHGLNGDAHDTWAPILKSSWAQSDLGFDLGLVNYASGLKRYRTWKQFSPVEVATQLAVEISQISPRKVVLVGHSMGGLIAKETAHRLYERFGPTSQHTKSLVGIVTMCTPNLGSAAAMLLSLIPGPAWRDRQVLLRNSQLQKDLELFFSTWVEVDEKVRSTKVRIPMYAGAASHDVVVNAMGAHLGVPGPQRTTLTGGHSSCLAHAGTETWLSGAIESMVRPKPLARAGVGVRSEFNGSGAYPAWEGAYRRALTEFADEYGDDAIADVSATGGADLPDLIVRAYSAMAPQAEVPAFVLSDVARQEQSKGTTALGISPIGPAHADAVQLLDTKVNAPRLRWFRGSADDDAEIVAAFRHFFDLSTGAVRSRESAGTQSLVAPWEGFSNEL